MTQTIYLTSKKKKTGLAAYREKKGFLPGVARVLTSPKTTIALGATLGTLLTAGALAPAATGAAFRAAPAVVGRGSLSLGKKLMPKTLKGAVKGVLGAGVVYGLGAPGIKKVTKKVFKTGENIGKIIDDPSKTGDVLGIKKDMSGKDKVIAGLKAAGIVGGVAAAGIVGAKALKKIQEKKAAAPQQLTPALKTLGFTEPRPVGIGGVPITQPQMTAPGAPGATKQSPAVSNIIQIQLA